MFFVNFFFIFFQKPIHKKIKLSNNYFFFSKTDSYKNSNVNFFFIFFEKTIRKKMEMSNNLFFFFFGFHLFFHSNLLLYICSLFG